MGEQGGRPLRRAVPFREVVIGSSADIHELTFAILRSSAAWEAFLSRLHYHPLHLDSRPIDWDRELVVAVVLGDRNTGGHRPEIGLTADEHRLLVTVTERRPQPRDVVVNAVTQPFLAVAAEVADVAHSDSVAFTFERRHGDGGG
jgi:hypothetical protein